MRRFRWSVGLVLVAVAVGVVAISATASPRTSKFGRDGRAAHVLLLSIDGLHQGDLVWYVNHNPKSALAGLVRGGVEFANAQTPFPSDSFPGMVAQVTGGNPSSTGIYYDDTWNAALLPAGTTHCAGVNPGVEVTYFEQLDKNLHALDAGQGLAGLPGSILQMTGDPTTLIDPSQLPVDPKTCKPVYPNQYLKVNTIFEVARQAGLRTAWADKHPAYQILDGPSGTGIQDLFTPEINSDAPTIGASNDWTTDNALTMQYDSYKVQAVLNEINGFDHSGTTQVGTPAIFGMNFQTVSTAEKLPTSEGLAGGYLSDGVTPGPLLSNALDYINTQVGKFVQAIHDRGLDKNTVIILSAKHGQSPQNPLALTRIPDGPIIEALNAAWKTAHPGAGDLVAFSVDDDGMLIWLHDRSDAATSFAKAFLLAHTGAGNDINGNAKPYTSSGLATVYAGADAANFMGVRVGDPRVPDLIGIAQYGVVYTGGKGKIAEHGGDNPQDRWVPLIVSGDPVTESNFGLSFGGHTNGNTVVHDAVETTQIAPTILELLGLNPNALQAVQIEHTPILPLG
jgi:predicted AlkP superfamily pyrophosphatase or phosphodiesterase